VGSKIVFKVKSFPTVSETFVVNNVVEAIKCGFDVSVITDKKNTAAKSSQENLLKDFVVLDKTFVFTQPKLRYKRYIKAFLLLLNPVLFYFFIKYVRFKKKRDLTLLFCLAFYYPHRKATAFHVHFGNTVEPLFELKKIGFIKSKIIVTFHGYDAHDLPKGPKLNKINKDFKKYVADITVNSAYLKNKLMNKSFSHQRISIVPIGIDSNFFTRKNSLTSEDGYFRLLSVGRLVSFKGHHFGVRVIKLLLDRGHNVKYSIIGEGPELPQLKILINKLKLNDSINLYGKKNQSEIKDFLNLSNVFLMTSTVDATGRREDFGVVSLEAQAMELPVVGFNSGGFPETIIDGKTGFLVQDQDVEGMVAAVEKLIHDRSLLQQMGKNAREHVLQNFSFEKTTKKYLELYL
jgi:colanic acid/amylovoran biosynthesis glycosyltransferase